MPVYEFDCQGCGRGFESLVRGSDTPVCPACGSDNLQRITSLFAVNSVNTRAAALKSARQQNMREIRDKRIAEHEEIHGHHD